MANVVKIVVTAVDQASKTFKNVGTTATQMEKGLKSARIPLLATTAAITGAGVASVKFASDLEEATNKAQVTFGTSARIIDQFAADSARSYGLSARAANEYTGTLGTILNASGLAQGASANMSVELVKLAADLASFNNIPIDIALEKLRSGLVGEIEPLRTVGVLLSQAEVEAYALREGMIAAGDSMTEAQKVQARYGLILEQTSSQQGDFQRTSESAANSLRILQAQTEDAAASLGTQLLPHATAAIGALSTGVSVFNNTSEEFKTTTIAVAGTTGALAALGLAIPPVIGGVRALSTATAFLAANPMVALVAVIGAVAVGGTLLSALRRTQEEGDAASRAMDLLTKAMNDAQAAAGAAGRGLSDQAAAVEALGRALADATSSADVFKAEQRLLAEEASLANQRHYRTQKALEELRAAQDANSASIEAAVSLVNQYHLTTDQVREVLRKTNLTFQDQATILAAANAQTAKAIAQQEGLATAHRETTRALEEEQEARRRALIEAAETTEEKLALVDAIAFAERLARGKENAERILAERAAAAEREKQIAEARAAGILAIEEQEAAASIKRREAYYESLRRQRWADVNDAISARSASFGGFSGAGSAASGLTLNNLFPNLNDPELLAAAPQLQYLKDYLTGTNPSAALTPGGGVVVNMTVNGDVMADDLEGILQSAGERIADRGGG